MLAILEAQTAAFEARMSAAGQQITRFGGTTTNARRGVMLLRGGMEQLAFQAAGIPGPVGRAVSAIGMLGVGSTVTVGVLAGVGAITMAYKFASAEANNLKASTDRLNQSYRDILAGGNPLVGLQNRLIDAQQVQTEAQEKFDKLSQRVGLGKTRGSPGEIALAQNQLDAATRVVEALRNLRPGMVEAAERVRRAAEELRKAAEIVAVRLRNVLQPGEAMTFRGNLPPGMLLPGAPAQTVPPILQGAGFQGITSPRPEPRTGFRLTPEFAIMSAMALAQGAQGGPGAFLSAAAGPVAMINPIAGAVTAAMGGFFSLFDRKASERELAEERRHKELIGVLHEGPARVTQIFEAGADPETAQYENLRQGRLGGEPRLGGL